MEPRFKKVTIVGMGFMGASLGLAVKKAKLAREVCGLGRNMDRLKKARSIGAADTVTVDIKSAVTGAELVVISLPVMMIPVMFREIKPFLTKDTPVTDMGSVKGNVCEKTAMFDTNGQFTGSHPVVGGEKTGAASARAELYRGGVCIVAGSSKAKSKSAKAVEGFWKALGMKVMYMTPQKHDAVMAGVSHLPHMAAFALVNANEENVRKKKDAIGTGFKSMTRIAASGGEIWSEIFLMNKREIMKQADRYMAQLGRIRTMVEKSDINGIKKYIEHSKKLRESLDK
ncbi:MAG: prephenate dehydrogenase [Spirochaetia bacterium]|nr:prephenate dehydrogenase [Spirochaetia bacterium]